MENNLNLENSYDLMVIANALEYYRDSMAKDIQLSADHPNIARYFRKCAEDADRVRKVVETRLGLDPKPWKMDWPEFTEPQEVAGHEQ